MNDGGKTPNNGGCPARSVNRLNLTTDHSRYFDGRFLSGGAMTVQKSPLLFLRLGWSAMGGVFRPNAMPSFVGYFELLIYEAE